MKLSIPVIIYLHVRDICSTLERKTDEVRKGDAYTLTPSVVTVITLPSVIGEDPFHPSHRVHPLTTRVNKYEPRLSGKPVSLEPLSGDEGTSPRAKGRTRQVREVDRHGERKVRGQERGSTRRKVGPDPLLVRQRQRTKREPEGGEGGLGPSRLTLDLSLPRPSTNTGDDQDRGGVSRFGLFVPVLTTSKN